MKTTPPSRLGLLSIASLASLLLPAFPASRAADADKSAESPKDGISGIWIGTLRAGAEELPVEFTIEPTGGGQFKGVLRSPKQTPEPMPITLVSFRDRDLKLVVDIVKGVYEGKVAANGKSIRGKWTQGGFTLALDLDYTPGGFAPNRPQTPKPPFPYAAEEVAFDNPLGKNRLAGTLTLPKNPLRPVPAVVLVTGSGPQDRDETIMGHKPFAVLADALTRKGIAVLRYDDRGVGKSTGSFEYGTTLDFATDAAAAVAFLKTRKEIDPARVGLIGHSEGGLVAPIVNAKRPGQAAFLVLLAAPGQRGDLILLQQNEALLKTAGATPAFVAVVREFNRAVYDLLTQPNPDIDKVRKLAADFETSAKKLTPEEGEKLSRIGSTIEDQMKALQTPWFANFLTLDPGEFLRQTKIPVLALNGERDLQVLADPNLAAIAQHLKAAENAKFDTRKLPDLNHLFQKAETGLPDEYWKIEETMDPAVPKAIAEWILSL
ncbi:MAG: alpha/beta hydrolase [Verrucomicrobiae bacterium]|nr:alpha/beta hydrolase [Verrucomicrobiae bacterium]